MEAKRTQKSISDLMKGFQIDQDGMISSPTPLMTDPSVGDDVDQPLFGGKVDALDAPPEA